MSLEVNEFQEKKYEIGGVSFTLKKPTISVKKQALVFQTKILAQTKTLEQSQSKLLGEVNESTQLEDAIDSFSGVVQRIYDSQLQMLKALLQAPKESDYKKITEDNITDELFAEIVQDFFSKSNKSVSLVR